MCQPYGEHIFILVMLMMSSSGTRPRMVSIVQKHATLLLVLSRLTNISNGGGEVYGNLTALQKKSYLVGLFWKIRF